MSEKTRRIVHRTLNDALANVWSYRMAKRLTLAERAAMHSALGDEHRLAIVDSLVFSDRSPSELGEMLGISSNLLAHHLDALEAAGLVERLVSSGDARRRYVHLVRRDVIDSSEVEAFSAERVLFVCQHNSTRSQLAAALWNEVADVAATSAGSHPSEGVHPRTLAVAAKHGLDLSAARPRTISEVMRPRDLVIAVCDRMYESFGSAGAPTLHWSVSDPSQTKTPAAYEQTYREIVDWVTPLATLVTRHGDQSRRVSRGANNARRGRGSRQGVSGV